ncbi:flagellar basal-body rod protein FlgF [Amantichitinum ursilacus]|uniref:Flagellar basal-body rod protein FlgF n=1 Tax=Amantichitinum ursilacus TaxID=857265 RepID=A0A0N0GPY5_9NEIS|nr:flagellar basal-body rod protein FlgF [Amantichitinum ursilacus]KPC53932.1 Flagellar basal-body rod protein FlgF [Amantichitinum ursilacus]
MDRLIYVSMTGAKQAMNRQATVSNNLANVSTPGFRADLDAFRAVPVLGGGEPTRAFVVAQTTGQDFTPGVEQFTGRDLDAAIDGDGWFTVQTSTGEAYTRNGGFEIDAAGLLKTRNGLTVLGTNGPITVPENTNVSFGSDGTVTGVPRDNPANTIDLGQLKLVNPATNLIAKGSDGLFRQRDGQPAQADANVKVQGSSLENSNVNAVSELVNMISAQRHYDLQVQMIQNEDTNARSAATLIQFSS